MAVTFSFEEEGSSKFGKILRPLAEVKFWDKSTNSWQEVNMLVDTGADYTLLPNYLIKLLGINTNKDCEEIITAGVGGKTKIFFLKERIKVSLGNYEREIPVGFADNNNISPIMGRLGFFETFKVVFEKFEVSFE